MLSISPHSTLGCLLFPTKRAHIKSFEYCTTYEIRVIANTLSPSQDIKTVVNGYVTIFVESIYNRCISVLTPKANSIVVSYNITLKMKDFFLAYLHRDSFPLQHPLESVMSASRVRSRFEELSDSTDPSYRLVTTRSISLSVGSSCFIT